MATALTIVPLQRSFTNHKTEYCEDLLKDESVGSEVVIGTTYSAEVTKVYYYVKTEKGFEIEMRESNNNTIFQFD